MSEITINKNNKSITFINNGIAFSQFGVADEILDLINNLQIQLQQKENIIKEARELVKNECWGDNNSKCVDDLIYYKCDELLEILDKGINR